MAAQGNKSSRWGNFLSQAVAGVEARLDTILAEEESNKPGSKPLPSPTGPTPAQSSKAASGPPRSDSRNRTNDRLQERLARAVAAKQAGQKPPESPSRLTPTTSPRPSLDAISRPSSEVTDATSLAVKSTESPRVSQDIPVRASEDAVSTRDSVEVEVEGDKPAEDTGTTEVPDDSIASPAVPTIIAPPEVTKAEPVIEEPVSVPVAGLQEDRIKQLEEALETAQLQYQEETHAYVEQIDALQSKLQYLSRETTETARKEAQAAPAGSVEKKLAEKDQQVALLMEEGKNLMSTEQKLRTVIKGLRSKITENEKELSNIKTSRGKLEADLDSTRRQSRRADDLEKYQQELHKRIGQSQKDIDALKSEGAAKDRTIADLKSQLQKAAQEKEALATKINDEALGKERKRARDLEEQVADLKVEKNLVADRAKTQATELREKAERAAERARAVEIELKAEIQIMESKLEAMRERAEEASSGAIGDSQAKLLRQIETLQSQYAIASENWQGIEATLLARITSLEKERDEAQQRESDVRKKAREAAKRAKRQEEELEETRTKLPSFEDDAKAYQTQIESLRKRAEEAETALQEAKADFEKQKASWKEEKANQGDQDRRGTWLEEHFKSNSRPESPLLSAPQRTLSSDLLGFGSLSNKLRKASAPSSNGDAGERFSRRPSAQPLSRPSIPGSHSATSPGLFSPTLESLPTPSINPVDKEDAFDVETTSSPQQIVQDMVSVSTVAAGPSVQLVERMSAAIRRLETEKVATKEELARISKQRDEARSEIVALMREAESGKSALQKVAELEAQVAEVNGRYETTLELLGEKSELVEELKSDVEDVKAMYRELVERTIK